MSPSHPFRMSNKQLAEAILKEWGLRERDPRFGPEELMLEAAMRLINNKNTFELRAEYWKEEYFNLIFKSGSYVNMLRTLNEDLRAQLHKLTCLRRSRYWREYE